MANTSCGGFSETKAADAKLQNLCDMVKVQVEERTNKQYDEFRSISYREQVVSGMNYLIKVYTGACSYIHVKVYESHSCLVTVQLTGVEENHAKEDPLISF